LSPKTTKSGIMEIDINNIQVINPKEIVFSRKINSSIKLNLNNVQSPISSSKLTNFSEEDKYYNPYLIRNS